jgi:hypothetical protein
MHQRRLRVRCPLQTIFAQDHAPSDGIEPSADGGAAALALDVRGREWTSSLPHGVYHEAHHGALQKGLLPPFLALGMGGRG